MRMCPNVQFDRVSLYRDAEEKLMADVEGWEVGTFYGHKVYKVGHHIRHSCWLR